MIKFPNLLLSLLTLLIFVVAPALAQEDADAVLAEQAKVVDKIDTEAKDVAEDITEEAIDKVADEVGVAVTVDENSSDKTEKKEIKPITDGDYEERLKLSKRMHVIWPMRRKIEGALDVISERIPQNDRLSFKNSMRKSINFEALEEASIDAMADIFTEKELLKMIDFYGSKEGRSVSFKTGDYEEAIQPVMIKMLDKAILDNKLGTQKR